MQGYFSKYSTVVRTQKTLWDWRATYCANEAPPEDFKKKKAKHYCAEMPNPKNNGIN